MPKYLASFDYSAAGTQGLLKDGGSQREKAVTAAVKAVGGKVEAFYFAFGQADAILILDLPDNVTAAALSLVVSASGAGALKTTPLLSPKDIDAAVKLKINYRAPGA